MDIILLERIEKLGSIGDVVTVKDGYARNYLLPGKKALRANDANQGKVVKTESWGLRSLAYKIKKNRKAHFVMLHLDAPAGVVAELERQTAINEDVIRYMTVRVDAHEEGPSVMMRKQDRERPRRRDREEY